MAYRERGGGVGALRIAGVAIISVILIAYLRAQRRDIALITSIAAGFLILVASFPYVGQVLALISQLAAEAKLNTLYVATIFKVIAVAYIVGFAAQICRDADEKALADAVEFAGKVVILVLAVPVVYAVFRSIMQLIPHSS